MWLTVGEEKVSLDMEWKNIYKNKRNNFSAVNTVGTIYIWLF